MVPDGEDYYAPCAEYAELSTGNKRFLSPKKKCIAKVNKVTISIVKISGNFINVILRKTLMHFSALKQKK